MSSPQLRNFHQQIVDALGSSIVAGHFAEGIQLPTEQELASTYGASRLIIREAMKSLADDGHEPHATWAAQDWPETWRSQLGAMREAGRRTFPGPLPD